MSSTERGNKNALEGLKKWLESEGANPNLAQFLLDNQDNLSAFRKGLRGEEAPNNLISVQDIPEKIAGEAPIQIPFATNAQGEIIIHTLYKGETPPSMEPQLSYELGRKTRKGKEKFT